MHSLVQEALTNIVKHAGARRVRVRAHESDTELTIEIADDGRGFDPDSEHVVRTPRRAQRTDHAARSEDWSAYVRRYVDTLPAADARRAQAVARDALTAGLALAELHARVITPAMYRIGELWAQRALTVADEHAATAISHDVLATLRSSTAGDPLGLGRPCRSPLPKANPTGSACEWPPTS